MKAIKAVEEARKALVHAEADLRRIRGRRRIKCYCGGRHAISALTLVIEYSHVEPYGCSGGDYWTEGHWHFACPANGSMNRILFDDYDVEYHRRHEIGVGAEATFKRIYRGLFAEAKAVHGSVRAERNFDSRYVDEHRKLFELPAKRKTT